MTWDMPTIIYIDHTFEYILTHTNYSITGIFRVGLIFAEFATFLEIAKNRHLAKNNPYCTSSLRVLEIGLSENYTHLPSVIFAKITRREKCPIYGILFSILLHPSLVRGVKLYIYDLKHQKCRGGVVL